MQLFYTPGTIGETYKLSEEESKHCIRVLRMQAGNTVYLTQGGGELCKAELADANPRGCMLRVVERFADYNKRNYSLHVAMAPTKNIDRFEWFLEKATEIGIDEITPLICSRSERKTINADRLERVIVAAMKQSIKAYKPLLHPQVSFDTFVKSRNQLSKKYIAHCQEGFKQNFRKLLVPNSESLVLIGPEGDFSPEEAGFATAAGYVPVSLGQERLRTETAGVFVCSAFSLIHQ
ncbi:MAG: 16S rRNA (uracil(1498)-N(3))-methyltransferase [Bacteroidota bacterium]|nr:MAG: 16S rRNA (uracil(1498)-N(3))-methyltransferase [Bacteroidota bacterium]